MVPRPPTPSNSLPETLSEYRFCNIGMPSEWIECYRPGRLHPVHIGDLLKTGQYKILRKLGYGSFSTVWLGKDQQNERYVALKILMSNATLSTTEALIFAKLQDTQLPHLGRQHTISLLDDFKEQGPNGEHQCLVFEVTGPSTATMCDPLPIQLQSSTRRRNQYPSSIAKSILYQLLLAIDLLHKNGIVHGDIQPGNILLAINSIDSIPETQLLQADDENSSVVHVKRLDGQVDLWAPRYIARAQPLTDFVTFDPTCNIKLSDLGSAFFVHSPPRELDTQVAFRSPELILKGAPTSAQDVWSFGCLIFWFLTGQPPFAISGPSDDQDTNDDHLLQLYDILGSIPSNLLVQWPTADTYFNHAGEQIKNWIGEKLPEDSDSQLLPPLPNLEEFFDSQKPTDFSDEESDHVKRILRWILEYDVCKRPSTDELLNDVWFSEIATNHSFSSL